MNRKNLKGKRAFKTMKNKKNCFQELLRSKTRIQLNQQKNTQTP